MSSHAQILPNVATSGVRPFSTRIRVAGLILISAATSRSPRRARRSLTMVPRLSRVLRGISPPPFHRNIILDLRNHRQLTSYHTWMKVHVRNAPSRCRRLDGLQGHVSDSGSSENGTAGRNPQSPRCLQRVRDLYRPVQDFATQAPIKL